MALLYIISSILSKNILNGGNKMAKDMIKPCVHYVCANEICKKGFVDVTMDKCSHCPKYKARKGKIKKESVKLKREKDRLRHDNGY